MREGVAQTILRSHGPGRHVEKPGLELNTAGLQGPTWKAEEGRGPPWLPPWCPAPHLALQGGPQRRGKRGEPANLAAGSCVEARQHLGVSELEEGPGTSWPFLTLNRLMT